MLIQKILTQSFSETAAYYMMDCGKLGYFKYANWLELPINFEK